MYSFNDWVYKYLYGPRLTLPRAPRPLGVDDWEPVLGATRRHILLEE